MVGEKSKNRTNSTVRPLKEMVMAVLTGVLSGIVVQWLMVETASFPILRYSGSSGITITEPSPVAECQVTWLLFSLSTYLLIFRIPVYLSSIWSGKRLRFSGMCIVILFFSLIISQGKTATVDANPLVRGLVSQLDYHYCLLVKPLESETCWVQGSIIPDIEGRFECQANIGGFGRFALIVIGAPIGKLIPLYKGETIPWREIAQNSIRTIKIVKKG